MIFDDLKGAQEGLFSSTFQLAPEMGGLPSTRAVNQKESGLVHVMVFGLSCQCQHQVEACTSGS